MKTKVLLLAALSSGVAYVYASAPEEALPPINPMEASMTAEQLQKQLEEADRRKAELAAQLEVKKVRQQAEEARLAKIREELDTKKQQKKDQTAVGKAALALAQKLEEEKNQASKHVETVILEAQQTLSAVEQQLAQTKEEKEKAQAAVAAEQQRLKQLESDQKEATQAVRAAQAKLKEITAAKKAAAETIETGTSAVNEIEMSFQRVSNRLRTAQEHFDKVKAEGTEQIDGFTALQNKAMTEKELAQAEFKRLADERKRLKEQLPGSKPSRKVVKGWLWNTEEVVPAQPDSDDEEFDAAPLEANCDIESAMETLRKKIDPQTAPTTASVTQAEQKSYSQVAAKGTRRRSATPTTPTERKEKNVG